MKNTAEELAALTGNHTPVESLRLLSAHYPGKVVFSTSLGLEDQVITHMIFTHALPIRIFTLDTGRLFEETKYTLEKTKLRYGGEIEAYYPNKAAVDDLVQRKGQFSFYESVDNRKECCYLRKVEPLQRALAGAQVWVTGIRAEQSPARVNMPSVEWDQANSIVKFHPLLNWTYNETRAFIQQHNVPYNSLHDQGFVSIGCAPCTRAIKAGEDFRAGRWWWESEDKKECGLHTTTTKI